jgi:putative IMPACT (imprinted ancient) family translation regulator
MLNALLGSGVGDVAAVVTRYFGGVKLGTGGLVRAYGGCVKEALASLPLEEHVERVEMALESSYAGAPELRRLLDQAGALVLEETYGAKVLLRVSVPLDEEPEFLRSLGRLHGLVRVLPGPRPG